MIDFQILNFLLRVILLLKNQETRMIQALKGIYISMTLVVEYQYILGIQNYIGYF